MKKILVHLIILGVTLISLNACGTIAGVGKDLQRAGHAVEKKAERY